MSEGFTLPSRDYSAFEGIKPEEIKYAAILLNGEVFRAKSHNEAIAEIMRTRPGTKEKDIDTHGEFGFATETQFLDFDAADRIRGIKDSEGL